MVLAEKCHIAADAHHWRQPRKRLETAINVLMNRDKGKVHLSINKLEYSSLFKDHVTRVAVKKPKSCWCRLSGRCWKELTMQRQVTFPKLFVDSLGSPEILSTWRCGHTGARCNIPCREWELQLTDFCFNEHSLGLRFKQNSTGSNCSTNTPFGDQTDSLL